jgi:hypothetical protein
MTLQAEIGMPIIASVFSTVAAHPL